MPAYCILSLRDGWLVEHTVTAYTGQSDGCILYFIAPWRLIGRAYSDFNVYRIGSKFAIKYNMQPSDRPVYRDLVMTPPYDDVIIHKLQYATIWLVGHTGGEGGGKGGQTSRHGAEREKEKEKEKLKKKKN